MCRRGLIKNDPLERGPWAKKQPRKSTWSGTARPAARCTHGRTAARAGYKLTLDICRRHDIEPSSTTLDDVVRSDGQTVHLRKRDQERIGIRR